jgi:hypothetical protein
MPATHSRPPAFHPASAAAVRGGAGRRVLLGVAVLALLGLALAGLWQRAPSGGAGATASAVTDPRPRSATDADASPRQRLPGAAPASLRERLERQDDLFAYWRDLQQGARAGDPEATWLMSQVADYCAAFSQDPAAYALDTRRIGELGLRGVASMVRARQRIGRRCAGFTAADRLTPAVVRQLRDRAARAGSLPAEAALLAMGRPLDADPGYARALVERVRASRDADAFNALSPAMGNSTLAAFGPPAMPAQFGELAWRLAACRLGMACGPDSNLMTAYCASGGICSRDASQGFEAFVYDAAVPNQGGEVVRTMVDTLVGPGEEGEMRTTGLRTTGEGI